MTPDIEKTIELIKKSYSQPILFHLLHAHLRFQLSRTNPIYEISDDWSKILIMSCDSNSNSNQGLEIKIQQNLKRYKPPFDDEKLLKTMIICYYLLNRPSHLINHILIYELVSGFLGYSNYIDGLILRIFSNTILARVYNISENPKLKEDTITRLQEIIKTKNLSNTNKIRSLICYIVGNTKPFDLEFVTVSSSFKSFKELEIICLYAKYTQNTSFIKEILPTDQFFIQSLKDYLSYEFRFETTEILPIEKCCLIDKSIFERIKLEFLKSNDKERFISELIELISSLK